MAEGKYIFNYNYFVVYRSTNIGKISFSTTILIYFILYLFGNGRARQNRLLAAPNVLNLDFI